MEEGEIKTARPKGGGGGGGPDELWGGEAIRAVFSQRGRSLTFASVEHATRTAATNATHRNGAILRVDFWVTLRTRLPPFALAM